MMCRLFNCYEKITLNVITMQEFPLLAGCMYTVLEGKHKMRNVEISCSNNIILIIINVLCIHSCLVYITSVYVYVKCDMFSRSLICGPN